MEFIMDMVHHNPGEAPFKTKFLDPAVLREFGYNAQVFKHVNTAISFSALGNYFDTPEAAQWLANMQNSIHTEIAKAKAEGLKVYYHVDLFVLPKKLVEEYKDEILNENGKIDLHKEKTKELHRVLFDELFATFDVDGLIVRVGETYLHDTPYHAGNGGVLYSTPEQEKADFTELLRFLREEICVRHDKYMFFRTWDIYPDKFHATTDYYLNITNAVDTHPKLIFSIKHTALDFWRRVQVNPNLTLGKHRQIVEVQCQREYEGKGAYPNYVMNGVINSFEENRNPRGLRDIVDHPLICGIYTWTRGGGWYGPYIQNEFWCELNAYVIAAYAKDPTRKEEEIFDTYAKEVMGLDAENTKKFRRLCLLSARAILKGRYCECFDRTLEEKIMPTDLWMRDDKFASFEWMKEIFEYLEKNELCEAALFEKEEAVELWHKIKALNDTIVYPDAKTADYIDTGIEYAIGTFTVVLHIWQLYVAYQKKDVEGMKQAIADYTAAREVYKQVEKRPQSATVYTEEYLWHPGIGSTIEKIKEEFSI